MRSGQPGPVGSGPGCPGPESLSRRSFLGGGFARALSPSLRSTAPFERFAQGVARLQQTEAHAPTGPATRVARILPSGCLAFRGTFCSTCRERCPLPGAMLVEHGRPRVVASVCDGCGLCADLCPAPTSAIALEVPNQEKLR